MAAGQEKNKDALFRFAMSEDGMKLGVNRYFPPEGGEGPSVELLIRQVSEAGVLHPIDEEAAERVIHILRTTGEVKRIPLVRGVPVREPADAALIALGDLTRPVFSGDRFAHLTPPVQARPGQTLDGRVIRPKHHFEPEDLELTLGDHVEVDGETGEFISQVWGMVRFRDGVLSVEPIPRVSEDGISVTGILHHRDFRGDPITPDRIEKEMRDMGVVVELDTEALTDALERAGSTGEPIPDQVLAQGVYPVPGKDGWFEFHVVSRGETGTEDGAGRLNFRDRGAYPMVEPGDVIGQLHLPSEGEGGIDLYGKTIPAHAGRPLTIHPGEGVEVSGDNELYRAKVEGVVAMEKGTLTVTGCLLVRGDVDMSTGNVHVEKGSVKIMGSVQAGAEVSAPGHIIVNGSVESSTVRAGRNIQVAGGILMPEGGEVRAEGSVLAGHTANARIFAGDDVIVSNDVMNTFVRTEGAFIATRGKGHVQGGDIVAAKGIEVNEIGSELGVSTRVAVSVDYDEDEALREQRAMVKAAIFRIDEAIGTDPLGVILARTPEEKRSAIIEVAKHRATLVQRRKVLSETILQRELIRQEKLEGIQIKARRLVHPGTVIRFGSKTLCISRRTKASVVSWSGRAGKIVFE